MRVKFQKDRSTKEAKPQHFKEGQVVDLPEASAMHWINRGVAVETDEAETAPRRGAAVEPKSPEPKPPAK